MQVLLRLVSLVRRLIKLSSVVIVGILGNGIIRDRRVKTHNKRLAKPTSLLLCTKKALEKSSASLEQNKYHSGDYAIPIQINHKLTSI